MVLVVFYFRNKREVTIKISKVEIRTDLNVLEVEIVKNKSRSRFIVQSKT